MRTRRHLLPQPEIPPQSAQNQQVINRPTISEEESPREQNETTWREKLEKLYQEVKSTPSFSAKISEFLRQNPTHSVHRRIVKKIFPRRKIITRYPFQIFQADLIEYSQPDFTYANKGYRFILIVIDCFSRMLYARPVKRKSSEFVADAFEDILNGFDHFPNTIITDHGLEFFNNRVSTVFKTYGINHYYLKTKTKWKTAFAERVIRTIKSRFARYFYKYKTKKWLDVLDKFVDNYNNTPHRMIGMSPASVTFQNSEKVYKRLFGNMDLKVIPRLSRGDRVRLLIEKQLFDKGYTQNWTEEIYKIKSVIQKAGVVWYKIETLTGQEIDGIKYYYQLNLVTRNAHSS